MTEITDLSTTDSLNTTITGNSLDGNVANMGTADNVFQSILGMLARSLKSSIWRMRDGTDPTKLLAFDLSGQTTALTRTQKTPDYSGTLGAQAKWTDIASAATTNLATATGSYGDVTGTATITALGTADAGIIRTATFTGASTLTHNATSLILPGSANILNNAGDVATFVSLGSGNWKCVAYQRASGQDLVPQGWEFIQAKSPAAAATVDFLNLSAYRCLRLSGYLLPATDNVSLNLRTDTNNGASFDSGASDYAWQFVRGVSSSANASFDINDPFVQVSASSSVGNGPNEGIHFQIELVQFNQASMTRVISIANEIITDGTLSVGTIGALRLNAAADNAFQLLFSSGNIASGYVMLEGSR